MDSTLGPIFDALNWADLLIVGVFALSTLVSIARGLLRELVSLMTWVLAVVLSATCSRMLADYLISVISTPSLRLVASLAILFVAALLIGAVFNLVTRGLIRRSGLSGVDRFFGIAFGALRALLVVGVMVLLGRLVGVDQDPWWQESILIHYFVPLAEFLQQLVPLKIHQLSDFLQWKDQTQMLDGVPVDPNAAPGQHPALPNGSIEGVKKMWLQKFSHATPAPTAPTTAPQPGAAG